jgi:hypothetical protein
MSKSCIICGCTYHSACQHPTVGPCSWHSDGLCSHCADPKIFLEAIRPIQNLQSCTRMDAYVLRTALKQMEIKVIVSSKYSPMSTHAVHFIDSSLGDTEGFVAIIKAWFPFSEQISDKQFYVNLSQSRMVLEKDYPEYAKRV